MRRIRGEISMNRQRTCGEYEYGVLIREYEYGVLIREYEYGVLFEWFSRVYVVLSE